MVFKEGTESHFLRRHRISSFHVEILCFITRNLKVIIAI